MIFLFYGLSSIDASKHISFFFFLFFLLVFILEKEKAARYVRIQSKRQEKGEKQFHIIPHLHKASDNSGYIAQSRQTICYQR